jgi:hypothetical protein
MAFHVEIARGHRTAREFNLDGDRLRRLVLEPWAQGREIRMGDREWLPAECHLTILQGPELSAPDLAYGRGWDRAVRTGRNVTRDLVAGAARAVSTIAVLAETGSGRDTIVAALGELGIRGVEWSASREPALASRRDSSADQTGEVPIGVILAVDGPEPREEWLYEAGVAVGALGGSALVVRLNDREAPAALAGLRTVESAGELSRALAAELGRLGSKP